MQQMNVEIVDRTRVSWQEFKTLRLEALKLNPTSFGRSYEEALEQTDEAWREQLQSRKYYFFYLNKRLVGMINYHRYSGSKTKHIFEINAFYVKLGFQGKGLGRQLLEKTLETIRAQSHARKVKIFGTVGNDPATKLYQSVGFKLVGIQKDELLVDGQFYDEMEFEMILN